MDEVLFLVGDAGSVELVSLPLCISPATAGLLVAAIVVLAILALSGLEASEGPRR